MFNLAHVCECWGLGEEARVGLGWGMEGVVSVSLYPRPRRVSGAVTALSSGRDTEVLPRCESHAGLHPGALLEGVLGRRQPCVVSGEYLRPELETGLATPL